MRASLFFESLTTKGASTRRHAASLVGSWFVPRRPRATLSPGHTGCKRGTRSELPDFPGLIPYLPGGSVYVPGHQTGPTERPSEPPTPSRTGHHGGTALRLAACPRVRLPLPASASGAGTGARGAATAASPSGGRYCWYCYLGGPAAAGGPGGPGPASKSSTQPLVSNGRRRYQTGNPPRRLTRRNCAHSQSRVSAGS